MKPNVYLTSPVFFDIATHSKVSEKYKDRILELKEILSHKANVIVSDDRFPEKEKITQVVREEKVDFIGCHLSHPISEDTMKTPSLKAVCTSTAGFNHIFMDPSVIITHTPGVLDNTVADYTISIILANLRNIISLHNFLWDGKWAADQKWDLDENLNNVIDNKVLGLVGLGEIGLEVAKRLLPWGVDIRYFDLQRNEKLENEYSNLTYAEDADDVFRDCDIVSLHIPLNKHTEGYVDERRLQLMKKDSLLVNTARGPIVDFQALIKLLKEQKIAIDLSFDVFDPEPISPEILNDFKNIAEAQPERRFVFIPHNASSDADTRAQMSIMILEDLITLVESRNLGDLSSLRFIPPQRDLAKDDAEAKSKIKGFRINDWW